MSESLTDLNGTFVKFVDSPAHAQAVFIPLYLNSVEHFAGYREDARKVIRVIMGETTEEEALELPEMGLNAMGVNNFLAAFAYEVLDAMYQCELKDKKKKQQR